MKAYEVLNPSFNDMDIDTQISHGINDWCVDVGGRMFFGQTPFEAEEQARKFYASLNNKKK